MAASPDDHLAALFADSGTPPPPPPHTARGSEQRGDQIGPFTLLETIGEGGFGVVWLAERRQPITQRVALKIIKPGMDSQAVIARFEQERQALAVMDHPGVARVLDAGATPAGRPYFVMEYVKGEPITTFCDRLRYTVRQRLELLAEVCEAVQHAHHKGLIHRDLKPSNVLVSQVDDRPVPKVIDFGVAKAVSHTLTDKAIFTETGQLIGTPEYMSPEQAEMGRTDIDTRTDVYSLGVMLYELLAGALPFDSRELRSRGYEAMCRIIREVEPPTPSARLSRGAAVSGDIPTMTPPVAAQRAPGAAPPVSAERAAGGRADRAAAGRKPADRGPIGGKAPARAAAPEQRWQEQVAHRRQTDAAHLAALLRRELEWIPLKAMRKDRARRYATPLNLAQDIRRYLAGEPLEAGPETTAYRLSKWLRRYRGPATAAALVFVALLLGLAGTLWQAHRADERAAAAERAEARATEATAEMSRVASELELQVVRTSQEAKTAAAATDYLVTLFDDAAAPSGFSLREFTPVELLDRGRLLSYELVDRPLLQTRVLTTIGRAFMGLGEFDRAASTFEWAVTVGQSGPTEGDTLTDDALDCLADALKAGMRLADAERVFRDAVTRRVRRFGEQSPEAACSVHRLGECLHSMGHLSEAEALYRRALGIREERLGGLHLETHSTLISLAILLRTTGRSAEAAELEALDRARGWETPASGAATTVFASSSTVQASLGMAFVSTVCIIAVRALGQNAQEKFRAVEERLQSPGTPSTQATSDRPTTVPTATSAPAPTEGRNGTAPTTTNP